MTVICGDVLLSALVSSVATLSLTVGVSSPLVTDTGCTSSLVALLFASRAAVTLAVIDEGSFEFRIFMT